MFLFKSSKKTSSIFIEGIEFVLLPKKIKNLYIRIKSDGKAYVSVPKYVTNADLQQMLLKHLSWVQHQMARRQSDMIPVINRFQSGELHYVWGQPYTLQIERAKQKQLIEKGHHELIMYVRDDVASAYKEKLMDDFYRSELSSVTPLLIQQWEDNMGVQATEWRLKKMKTRWGTCNTHAKRIWLNIELGKYPLECFEYVLVHELVHLLERSHNARFKGLMTNYLPDWSLRKRMLNELACSGQAKGIQWAFK